MKFLSYRLLFSRLLALTVSFCAWGIAFAEPGSADPLLDSQRFHYQKAKLALAEKDTTGFQESFAQLGDYPLKQYLEYGMIRNRLSTLPLEEVDNFRETYPDTFLASRLTYSLLHLLASRGKWHEFLKYYPPASPSTSLKCQTLYAKRSTGQPITDIEIEEVWDVGRSQPKSCDPLFQALLRDKRLKEPQIWSRFQKAVVANKTGLARYLSRHLETLGPSAELMLKVHNKPELVTGNHLLQAQTLPTQQIIAHGIGRLAYKRPLDALYHWELYEAQQLFPDDLRMDTKLTIVKRLIRSGHAKEAQHLLSYSHQLREQTLVEEVIREALADQNWQRVDDTILLLDARTQREERWLYWRARAQDELDRPLVGFTASTLVYQKLAKNRSFYGFLSADKLSQGYSLEDQSVYLESSELDKVAKLGVIRRIHELWLTGNHAEARAEWLHSSAQFTPQQLMAAGQLARDWGWYNTGIQAMISGNFWDQLTVRFPLAYREQIFKTASDTQVEPTLIYAIARQESAFDSEARSPVGAMGLMQLMPKTAQYTAETFGVSHSTPSQLLNVEHNMLLGGHYLNHLLERFDGNRILAAAAYNAGPHRVSRWLSDAGKERPFDVWIETIPFKETRGYVQNVLCFSVIYSYRLGQPTTFVSPTEASRFL